MSDERLHIALVGPAEPRALAHHLNDAVDIPDGLGGVPVNELADGLLSLGHRVSIYTSSPSVSRTVRLEGERLDISIVPYRHSARARALDFFRYERRELESELRSSGADVFHVHWTYEFALAGINSGKSPLLVTAHDAPLKILRYMPDAYRLFRTALAIRTRFSIRELTAVSPYLAHRWRREMFYRRPISLIANIDPELPPASPSIVRSRWVILDVANDSRLKNVRTLIRAFEIIVKKYPEAELRLVGPGLAAEGPIAEWARSRRLDTNVTFVGPVDRAHIADEYARASVLCHASREESQGIALLEALHAGLVVIGGAASGAVPWTLFDGRAGILVDTKSSSAIADGIVEALARVGRGYSLDPELAQAIEARYGRDAVIGGYIAVYRRLIAEARKVAYPGRAISRYDGPASG